MLRQQLIESLGGARAPEVLKTAVHSFENEERAVSYLDVTSSSVPAPAAPTDEQLRPIMTATKWCSARRNIAS